MGKQEKNEQELSDLELISRCSEKDVRAQELLYRRYFSFAMSVAVRYTCNEGEAMEIVNDSFMKVLEKTSEFDTARPFRSWYGRIIVNSAVDNYRRNVKHSSHLQISDIEATEEQEPEIDASLSAADILQLFSKLPEQFRVTFNMFEIEGYSHYEIGQMLGITASSSRSNLTRAKKMLRELYIKNFNTVIGNNEAI
ncbi:MAG: sigma-70 family RNA polymerase sigma factor [Bacteroidales bacterium]|jgi:RNA polymerase sigma-70 factor (ECF subfamily)|nr:sigma-70 family RNA polymerase sigma factor [Bacteroidales bacterium]